MQEKIAGPSATSNKDHVIGVDLRAFVAPKSMVGPTLQMDVMDISVEKQSTNVLQIQVSKFFKALT